MTLKKSLAAQGAWLFRYRGTLPIIILIVALPVFLMTELNPERFPLKGTRLEFPYEMLCLAVSLLGLFVRAFTVGYTPANTSGRNVDGQLADRLNITGLYSVVRNPLYLGNFLMWLGIGMLTMNLWFIVAFCLMYWLYYERIIYTEEEFLTGKFGAAYTGWADRTPCFFPRLKGYVRPSLAFSWKKVIKKEKNGLLALFLIFTLFDSLGAFLSGEPYKWWLIGLTGAILVLYLVVKYIKHKTRLLDETGR